METLVLFIYIIMAVHGEGGIVALCNLCNESDPSAGCVGEIGMKIGGKKKKRTEGGGGRANLI